MLNFCRCTSGSIFRQTQPWGYSFCNAWGFMEYLGIYAEFFGKGFEAGMDTIFWKLEDLFRRRF